MPRVLEHVNEEFGQPVPGWAFGGRQHQKWVGVAPSVWMYRREKASRHRVGKRYSPPTPRLQSPELEVAQAQATLPTSVEHDPSPSNSSEVSLGPEEDGEMVDIDPHVNVEVVPLSEPGPETGPTYILIHGHSFSFGSEDLRSWLRRLGNDALLTSIAGVYQLLQSNYQVDYLFKINGSSEAENLRQAVATPPPENVASKKPKLPTFKKNTLRSEEELGLLLDLSQPSGDFPARRPNDRDSICRDEARLLLDMTSTAHLRTDASNRSPGDGPHLHITGEDLPGGRLLLLLGSDHQFKSPHKIALGARNGDGILQFDLVKDVGRMSARTTWGFRHHSPPTAPRADRLLTSRVDNVPTPVVTVLLIQRLTEPKKPLLERLQPLQGTGKRALLERMDIGLKDWVLSQKAGLGHKRTHNQLKKRLKRLLRLEEEIRHELEEIRWTDAEIDWFIEQEEMLPTSKEDDNQMDVD
ncbi:hypothetical protein DFH08DRAFT_974293 [Mycena albidolilacea]|uniref:Uncharacterized protein n=1 Tax=Mycena albidolilacea TaxID=1033008 RepID=A0AAD6Z713_9AGAR|nr:hypothetical protein DFH08DRAFT_974293 [Mycena albidolilacea]